MKRIIILILCAFLTLPAVAWTDHDEEMREESLNYLNQLVKEKQLVKKVYRTLKLDDKKIQEFKNNSQKSPDFAYSCMMRNKVLLKEFEDIYFLPAYNHFAQNYKKPPLTFYWWIHTTAMEERSAFYDFYRSVEINYEECEKIYNNSK